MEIYAFSNDNALMLTLAQSHVGEIHKSLLNNVESSADNQGNGTVWQSEK